jgi:hypothetical protein
VQDVLDEVLRQHDARLMEEFERRLHEHHLIAGCSRPDTISWRMSWTLIRHWRSMVV